ncbi:hypothetical protein [Aquabacterium sp.]|uniref:hypothetical protein n=1 Tax=Aquabacterium sp. TaxID=1872578 RepID=UPI003783A2CF
MNPPSMSRALVPYQPPRARRPWGRWLLVLTLLGLVAGAIALYVALDLAPALPFHVIVDGDEISSGIDLAALSPANKLAIVGAVLLALVIATLVVTVVLPVTLLVVAVVLLLVLVAVLGAPLLAVAAVLAVLASPLLLIGGLFWLALRGARRTPSATMRG